MYDDCLTVAGGGSWGTALANLLAKNGQKTYLWLRDPVSCEAINSRHENPKYLPKLELSKEICATLDPAVLAAPIVIYAISCQSLRTWLKTFLPYLRSHMVFINVAKGLELSTGLTCQAVFKNYFPKNESRYAILSGPSFAAEVIAGKPTAVSLACADLDLGRKLSAIFSKQRFRAYATDDVLGVELGGALKNVMAIGAGICDALQFGANALSAYVTRALAEMARVGRVLGAKELTFMGLSGLGDLSLTCFSNQSRNRRLGLRLGAGEEMSAILKSLGGVAEGVATTSAMMSLAQKHGIDTPLTKAIYDICFNHAPIAEVVHNLFERAVLDERRV